MSDEIVRATIGNLIYKFNCGTKIEIFLTYLTLIISLEQTMNKLSFNKRKQWIQTEKQLLFRNIPVAFSVYEVDGVAHEKYLVNFLIEKSLIEISLIEISLIEI